MPLFRRKKKIERENLTKLQRNLLKNQVMYLKDDLITKQEQERKELQEKEQENRKKLVEKQKAEMEIIDKLISKFDKGIIVERDTEVISLIQQQPNHYQLPPQYPQQVNTRKPIPWETIQKKEIPAQPPKVTILKTMPEPDEDQEARESLETFDELSPEEKETLKKLLKIKRKR